MRFRVYAVLDKAVEAYLQPMFFRAEGEAIRSFIQAVSDGDSMISKHKQDYAFCFLGYYDDTLGALDKLVAPVVVCEAATVLAKYDVNADPASS